MILIDTSLYIGWLRRGIDIPNLLEPWLRPRLLATCGVVRAEVIRGVPDPSQKRKLDELFDVHRDVPMDRALWKEITDLGWSLDRSGQVLPITDLIIASCAKQAGAAVVTTDQHFHRIPELEVLPHLPVA